MKHLTQLFLMIFILALGLQLAGCGAAEISSAKLYRQQRNYVKANEMLEKAIQSEPTSEEAWVLYIQNLYDLKRFERIAEVIDTARKYAVNFGGEVDAVQYNTWVELYNGALMAYNANPDSKEAQKSAIALLESARQLSPGQAETYELLGQIYLQSGDTAKGIETYTEALKQLGPMHERGIGMGLMLKMNPDAAQKAVGTAAKKSFAPISASDSAMVLTYPDKQLYLYFEKAQRAPYNWELSGWRFSADDRTGLQPIRVSPATYEILANYYYQQGLRDLSTNNKTAASKAFDQAVAVLLKLQQVDPANEFASQAIPDMYQRLDRIDQAKAMYEKLLQTNPTKTMYTNYGTLLLKSNDYQGSIAAFEKAIGIDQNYEAALFNLGVSYRNWAAAEQKAKRDWKSKLQKSTDYFEKLHQVNRSDFSVLYNLIDNYDVLGNKDKQQDVLKEMEQMKDTEIGKDPSFWESLGKLYAKFNKPNESAEAYKKADQLRR